MFITFRNTDEYCKVVLTCENRTYTLEPKGEIEVPLFGTKKIFTAEVFMPDFSDDLQTERNKDRFSKKVIKKLAKKFLNKLPELALRAKVTYELENTENDSEIFFGEGAYSSCDGYVADFFDMMPVGYFFALAETNCGKLKVVKVETVNRKQYLKVQRNFNLFMDWGLILPDLFLFIPKYFLVKFYYTSDFYVSKTVKDLYKLSPAERIELFNKKEKKHEKVENGFGCLKALLWGLAVLAVLVGLSVWALNREPDVVMNEDFSEVVCFDEVFVRTDGGLPSDAKETFLEDYAVDYHDPDGGYDRFSYQCHIYEDAQGNRYMWVKPDCDDSVNYDKDYEDYENPLVFRSTGDKAE